MNDMHNFAARKNCAINELKQMNKRATKNDSSCKETPIETASCSGKRVSYKFDISPSGDNLLIIGLLIILYEDCQDIWLFLALIYILL